MFALTIFAMIGGVGLAVDAGLAYLARDRMTKALDAAGLAAARVMLSDRAEADARRFFDANFPPGYLSTTVTSFTVEPSADNAFISVAATATKPTLIMGLLGYDTLDIAEATLVERQNRGLEIALVMDNTGSMRATVSGARMIDSMKSAATELVEILFDGKAQLDHLWVSVVPYTATVNIGPSRTGWLVAGDGAKAIPSAFAPADWKGCVMAGAFASSDRPPSALALTSYLYPDDVDNDWTGSADAFVEADNDERNGGRGPNLGCGPAITSLTNRRQTVIDAIAEMQPWHRGGTTSNLGLVWGWRTISPTWRGLWGGPTPDDMPLPYVDPLMDKAIVLLTDGNNVFHDNKCVWKKDGAFLRLCSQHSEGDHAPTKAEEVVVNDQATKTLVAGPRGSDFTAYGRLHDWKPGATTAQGEAALDAELSAMCAAIKAEEVTIFTITFGSTPDAGTKAMFEACASDPANYFHAPNGATLTAAFSAIGERLSNLRLVE